MATALYDAAISKLGTWNWKISNEDLSTIIFYDDNGNEIPRPSDFPTNEQIETAKAEEQTRLDNLPNLRASAKAKLIAGEALTEEEASVIIRL